MIRTAIIGVGGMGSKYAEMIAGGKVTGMILSAVVIRRDTQLEWGKNLVNSDGSSAIIFRNTDELYENPDTYDAVLIVTPHKSHRVLAVRAFELGKHVFCDKPAGSTVADAKEMTNAANESGKIYAMMFHQRRYEKYLKIKQMIENDEIGKIRRVIMLNSRYFRTRYYHKSGTWRSSFTGEGGGALINQGQHILDIWQWLFGMPDSIYASIPFGKYNDFCVDDEATIMMSYPEKMTGVFMLTTGEATWQERLEIIGSRGKIILEDEQLTIIRHSDIDVYISTAQVNSREELELSKEIINFVKSPEPYVEMLENFVRAVETNDESILYANGKDADKALILTNGAYMSAYYNEPVSIPFDEEKYLKVYNSLIEQENS